MTLWPAAFNVSSLANFWSGRCPANQVATPAALAIDATGAALSPDRISTSNPDFSRAQIYLTAFQFEDFKQFIRNRVGAEDQQRFFRVDYGGISEGGTSFIPGDLIEVVLELDYEWKAFINQLNALATRKKTPDTNVRDTILLDKINGSIRY